MDKQYQAKNIEKKVYQSWKEGGFFNPDNLLEDKKGSFAIATPPPNVTGALHMGHALNFTIQDTLIRWKRMQGFKTLLLPGTDHAGIATQNVVEKKLKKEGQTRFDLGRDKFIEKVWEWKKEYGGMILKQIESLGVSCDWSRTRFTMDDDYTEAVHQSFLHYYNKGLVYRGKRAVNWCPRCQTSLSDLELEYKEEKGKLWFIKYKLKDKNEYIKVATTRPETMLGDTAVAVNSKDERYKKLVGETIVLPIVNREIPIVADDFVDLEFGTGAVKVTPAHDMGDYQISQRHKLEVMQVIDENGRMNNVPAAYQGLKTKAAREEVVAELDSLGVLEKVIDYTHQIPKCYRCNTTIEVIPSWQWFVKMDKLAKLSIDAVKRKEIVFTAKRWEKGYFSWLENIQDWCISRQIWWGHRLPVWFCQTNKEAHFTSIETPEKCSVCGKCQPQQSEDVFDTWFSAALWPFATLGWPKKTKDLEQFYPTDIICTARDIINFWVVRMIFSSLELLKQVPFKKIIIHATIMTKDGRRMSKSLGTGIDPMDLIERYGADATRFGLSWQVTELQDIRFGEENMMAGKKFCNKIWNASRFVMQQVGDEKFDITTKPKPVTKEDKKILSELERTIKSVDNNLAKFYFGAAIQEIYRFFWHQFCDLYIEEAKNQIKEEKSAENTKKVLIYVLATSLKILHPCMPFITEEIYQSLPLKEKKALIIEKWPE